MARRSPKDLDVSPMYDIGCSWRLYRIFHFRERQAKRRLVSNRSRSNVHAIENGSARSRPDVVTTDDEKHPHTHIDVNSKRRRDYGCKSISCVQNNEVAAVQRNKATNMVVGQNFINTKYLCKDGAVSQPHQFFDALQIMYSNKELFLKLLRDPDSLLVKQIYDLEIPQFKEQNQAGPNMSTRPAYESKWIHSQKRNATQTVKPSLFPFSHIKRKLRKAMGLRPGGDKVIGLESVERNSQNGDHSGFAKGGKSSVDLKKREKMRKMKDFTLCIGQGAVSVGESCGRNMTRNSVSPSEQNIENTHVEATENLAKILNCTFEEQNINDSNLYLPTGSVKIVQSSHDLHPKEIRYMDVPFEEDSRHMDIPSQSSDMDVTTEETESVMDSPHEMQDPSFSPEVASSTSTSCQSVDDPHAAEFPVQAVHDKFENHHVGDLVRSSSDPMNCLITSMETPESHSIKEIIQVISLKWDELVMKYEPPDQLTDPSTFEERKRLTNQPCDSTYTVFFDYVKEVFTETYQNFIRSLYQCSVINSEVQAYVFKRMMVNEVKEVINLLHCQHQSAKTLNELVEKDLARHESWLNVQVDAEDIAVEVEEDVLQELILEIVSEMHIRSLIHSYI